MPRQLPIENPAGAVAWQVAEIGGGVTRFKVGHMAGDRRCSEACGSCRLQGGKENERIRHSMDTGRVLKGGYSEYVTVHEDYASRSGMRPEYAAPLFCHGITALAVKAAEAGRGLRIGIFGIGGVG